MLTLSLELFLKGILLGLLASMPMGPVGVLCVQKTVSKGRITGFTSGLGASLADSMYAFMAAFGVSYITDFMIKNQIIIQSVGVIVLAFIGIQMVGKSPLKQFRTMQVEHQKKNLASSFLAVFLLTLTNPLTIIFFGSAFTMLNVFKTEAPVHLHLFLIAGVFAGTALWWFGLSTLVGRFRERFRLRNLVYINRISGLLILILTLGLAIRLFFL